MIILVIAASTISAKNNLLLDDNSKLQIELKDFINVDTYSWPQTLLTYPIHFSGEIAIDNLVLINKIDGKEAPFQLSNIKRVNGKLVSADLNLIADLPTGGSFSYELSLNKEKKSTNTQSLFTQLTKEGVEISNGNLQVRLPASQSINSTACAAPIIALGQGNIWMGNNKIKSPSKKIISVDTKAIETGELYVSYQITYLFEGNSKYITNVKVIKNYPFVILDEEMLNFQKSDSVNMDLSWKGFQPTKRFGTQWGKSSTPWLSIDNPISVGYGQEDPHWSGLGWIEDPSKEMIHRLTPFGGNSVREQTPIMSFWEENQAARELAVFVYDHNRWNDKQYGIWQPTPDLCVYFSYRDKELHFKYPIQSGTRSTAISLFPKNVGDNAVNDFNQKLTSIIRKGRDDINPKEISYRYSQLLHQQYASLSLDRIKEWQLSYPETAKRPENPFPINLNSKSSADKFFNSIVTSPMVYYPLGLNFFPGIHSIKHRTVYSNYVEGYLQYYKLLTEEQRQTVEALFLVSGYVNTLEEMNAIRTCLAGTANMAADGWSVSPQMSHLFPEHSMAKEWMDFFEKNLELYGLFYTRPAVKSYESKGGRWLESLGTYNWAYFRPTSFSNIASEQFDGKNRFANPYMADRAKWMVDMLTAPVYTQNGVTGYTPQAVSGWKPGDEITEEKGLERGFTPHGAHGGGVFYKQPATVTEIGNWMENFNPILAENMKWSGGLGEEVEHKKNETNWVSVFLKNHPTLNRGTNPHLKSCKYTGHGIVLRAGVDTPEELSIHLDQVDKGPNYRWGNQGQGNSGGIYFYAQGQILTGHENEIAGDHVANNLDGLTNFGFMKNGEFRTIGMNELTSPLYDFGIAQFAELTSAKGKDNYVWPEYESRSIMLVGTDYFILYDETGTNWQASNRFSWFIPKKNDFPKIQFLSKIARGDHWSVAQTNNSKGFYRDSEGSVLTLVTHKKKEIIVKGGKSVTIPLLENENISEFVPDRKIPQPKGVVRIETSQSNDIIFRDRDSINYETANESFIGKAGVIRRLKNTDLQLSLFKGEKIGADGITLELKSKSDVAFGLTLKNDGSVMGIYKASEISKALFSGLAEGAKIFIDGVEQGQISSKAITELVLQKGEHQFECVKGKATPLETKIISAEYEKSKVKVELKSMSPVEAVRIDISYDGGKTWKEKDKTNKTVYYLNKEKNEKVHIRAVSLNGNKVASIAQEYPIYFTDNVPHYPDGLWLKLSSNKVELSWGEVLGVQKYKLYRRNVNSKSFELIYEGKERSFIDSKALGVVAPFQFPGTIDNASTSREGIMVYEYAISSRNGNGESLLSPIVNTDPSSWRNWYPQTELKFKRQSAFWMPPYVYPNMSPEKYYPN